MRKVDLKIVNSKIPVGNDLIEAGVAINEGKIVKVAKEPNLPPSDATLDSRRMLMMPGIVDVHVHLRDMAFSYKEDFSSGTEAAVVGGVTTVLDMPNTSPPTTNAERLREKIGKATNMIYSNVGFFGALALEPNENSRMIEEGAIGFKLYLNDPQYGSLSDETLLGRVLEPLEHSGAPLSVHAEFPQKEHASSAQVNNEITYFLKSHDPQMEVEAVSMCIKMAKEKGVHVHVCHLSTESALNLIGKERISGTQVTAEVTPHHLLLSRKELYHYGSLAKMVPPLRTARDAKSLMQGLNDGTVDIVASDHAPHTVEEKQLGFTSAPSGIPGLETMLPLILTEMYKGRITLRRIIETMSEKPSRLFELEDRGKIAEGYSADIILVNLQEEKTIDAHTFHSKAKYTPFEGRKVRGFPILTLVNGIPVMQDGEIICKPGDGRIVKRKIGDSRD